MVLCLEIAGGSVFGWVCGVCWGSSTAWECCVSGGEAVLGFSFFFPTLLVVFAEELICVLFFL